MKAILGISAFYHDSAAALVVDGEIVAAAQEERFTRKKYDAGFPVHAIDYCLKAAGLTADRLDFVGFYDKPLLKFERLIETYLAFAPAGFDSFRQAMPLWLNQKLHLPREMSRALGHAYKKRFVFTEHHESHAASAFFPSPFDEAAILTLDGVGEWATASYGVGRGSRIDVSHELHFPHSLGLLYSAFTYFTGFTVNSGEYKLMGLAPYGEPKYVDLILKTMVDLKDDGSLRMDMSYFNYCQGLTMTSRKFHELFGATPRKPDTLIREIDMDLAASVQKVTEEVMLRASRHLHAATGLKNLCLAGGVALNCVGNGRILREGPFERIWIQPAAGDAGGALGVALFIWHQLLDNPRAPRPRDQQRGSLLGPSFGDDEIRAYLDSTPARYDYEADDERLFDRVARALAEGRVVGWFQGRMEYGPRALGARSILGDPRNAEMQTTMNVKVKFREGFRPFAPAVRQEHVGAYFDVEAGADSPYMLLVSPVKTERRLRIPAELASVHGIAKLKQLRSEIPAVTHVDYSARIQTVDPDRHGPYRALIEAFHRRTGCPVVVNTSFNLGWDPIVCTPKEAFETFMASDIDLLCMGHYVVEKTAQPAYVSPGDEGGRDAVIEDLGCSPDGGSELDFGADGARCRRTGRVYRRDDGIWRMLPTDAEDGDGSPAEGELAGYDEIESIRALIEACRRDPPMRALDRAVPYNANVLDVGCGAGRLTNYLGVSCRRVIGTDVSMVPLRLAERFRIENGLSRVRFVQMDPRRPCFRPGRFEAVVCHAPSMGDDPELALGELSRLVVPGGHFVLRVPYRGYRVGDVLDWLDRRGLEFVRRMPSMLPDADGGDAKGLFEPEDRGSGLERLLTRARDLLASGDSGRAYLVVARVPKGASAVARETAPIAADAAGRA